MPFAWTDYVDTIVQAASILLAIVTFIVAQLIERVRRRAADNREVYQRLELAAIDLYRFEAEHLEVTKFLWEADAALPAPGSALRHALDSYVCQHLSLLEMAAHFRRDRVMPDEVFASWVIWYYELRYAPHFAELWPDLRWNYIGDLRDIMDGETRLSVEDTNHVHLRREFYALVAARFSSKAVRDLSAKMNGSNDDLSVSVS